MRIAHVLVVPPFVGVGLVLWTSLGRCEAQVQTIGVFPPSRFAALMQKDASQSSSLYKLPSVNLPQVLAREVIDSRNGELKYYKYGEPVPYRLDMKTAGEWVIEAEGQARVWRVRLQSAAAESLSVIFDQFYLPPGAELYVLGRNVRHARGEYYYSMVFGL